MAAAWKDVIWQLAFEVELRCFRAHGALAVGAVFLAPPVLVAEARAAGGRILVALATLESAVDDLTYALCATTAAEIIALRGAAADPTTPLPSIEHIPVADRDARLALRLLQSGRDRAEAAHMSAWKCSVRLRVASDLLDFAPGLPALDEALAALAAVACWSVVRLRFEHY